MKNIIILITVVISFVGCGNNAFQKEITEVEGLLNQVKETEKTLLSIDTSRVFAANKLINADFKNFTQYSDTLTKVDALRVGKIFGSKKKFSRISKSYGFFVNEIIKCKKQLNNLKADLENGLVKKEQFSIYINTEKNAYNGLMHKINKSTGNFEEAIGKYELERPELLELIEKRKARLTENE